MKDIIPAKKESPILGLSGMGGGVGSNIVAGGGKPQGDYVDNLFSTQTYLGNGNTTRQFTSGLDLSTHGGLVWFKNRSQNWDGMLIDSARGLTNHLKIPSANAQENGQNAKIQSFNTNGYTIEPCASTNVQNENGNEIVAWSWRKATGFFDIVTYTGNSTGGTTHNHNLGAVPKFMVVKRYAGGIEDWICYHVSKGNNYGVDLGTSSQGWQTSAYWNDTTPTSTQFTLGSHARCNGSGTDYVCYLFGDEAIYGDGADNQVAKMGSYTGNGNSSGPTINLGFEPQFVLIKNTESNGTDWVMVDSQRGMTWDGNDDILSSSSTSASSSQYIDISTTGFQCMSNADRINKSGNTFIYYAVRRPDTKVRNVSEITLPTHVFDIKQGASSGAPSFRTINFVNSAGTDAVWSKNANSPDSWLQNTRNMSANAQGQTLSSNNANSQGTNQYMGGYDFNHGFNNYSSSNTAWYTHFWLRWKGFDTVSYTGNNVDGRSIPHSLGQNPEMIWVKDRTSSYDWMVWHKDLTSGYHIRLNESAGETTSNTPGLGTVSSTTFNIGSYVAVNQNGSFYQSWLYSSVPGYSKLGTYTGSSSAFTIDCGFQPRFFLLKGVENSRNWITFNTVQGWGKETMSDPEDATKYMALNDNGGTTIPAVVSGNNIVCYPVSNGVYFTGLQGSLYGHANNAGSKYIYYAVA